jgi:hypothetical protein
LGFSDEPGPITSEHLIEAKARIKDETLINPFHVSKNFEESIVKREKDRYLQRLNSEVSPTQMDLKDKFAMGINHSVDIQKAIKSTPVKNSRFKQIYKRSLGDSANGNDPASYFGSYL